MRNFEKKLPHTENDTKDRFMYNHVGLEFLMIAIPETIYWGNFINSENDLEIADSLNQMDVD